MSKKIIGIIGGGNMGEALLARAPKGFSLSVSEKDEARQKYLKKKYKVSLKSLSDLAKTSNILILAVKPQDMESVLNQIAASLKSSSLVISIAAGITTQLIEKNLRKNIRVIRTMPNMPALIGRGITAVCAGQFAKKSDLNLACRILNNLGQTVVVEEKSIDAITAVSGSGPAYVYLFMECLIEAAKEAGLSRELAETLVKNTFLGSSELILKKNADPADLRIKVTSKGGTTEAAMEIFLQENIGSIIKKAVKAAELRAKELAR